MKRYPAVFLAVVLFAAFAQSQQTTPAQTCPVEIKKIIDGSYGSINRVTLAAELGLSSPSRGHVGIDYTNRSDKDVITVRFGVGYINSMHELAYTDVITTKQQKLKPGKTFGVITPNGFITGGEKANMRAWVQKVMFADGSYWNDDGSRSCGNFKVEENAPTTSLTSSAPPPATIVPQPTAKLQPREISRLLGSGAILTAVTSVPASAEVKFGETAVGYTPAVFLLQPGETHTITITTEGYKPVTQPLVAGRPIFIQLEPDKGSAPATAPAR
jgi:hypothetical protein